MLRLELGDLKLAGFDLWLTGFGELELGSLLADKRDAARCPGRPGTPPAQDHEVVGIDDKASAKTLLKAGELIDRIAASAPVRELLVVKALGHTR